MADADLLERWCWKGFRQAVPQQELFSLARRLAGRTEIAGEKLEDILKKTMEHKSQPGQKQADRRLSEHREKRFEKRPRTRDETPALPDKDERTLLSDSPADGIPGGQRGRGKISRPISWPHDGSSLPASDFARLMESGDKALFEGLRTQDEEDSGDRGFAEQNLTAEQMPVPESSSTIVTDDQRPAGKVADHRAAETGRLEIRRLVEHLIELSIVSPTLIDTFLVNQDQVAYLMAKQAFLSMAQLADQKRPLRSGTHQSGTRGRQTLQLDRTRRTRQVSSRLAMGQTLRRGMARRVLFPLSGLIDEEDLIEFASRKKVGYSIVIAVDISGAVQFGRRIQGVRKACMAFSYYLRRFHPRDRVRYVAYHEVPREIRFSSVPRLRAVNGVGKDIGACLKKCRELLRQDPDRVPAIVLIGDGLPARGEQAGFYRFMENNRDVIEHACGQARMLRREEILFTFLQFREDRHLWQEYADQTAMSIAREARGTLYRIDSAVDIVSSLLQSYARFKGIERLNYGRRISFA